MIDFAPMKYLSALFLSVLLAAIALGCGPAEDYADAPAQIEQAASQPCLIEPVAGTSKTVSPVGLPGFLLVSTKLKNYGTQTCPYQLSFDFYSEPYVSPGTVVYATPIVSNSLASSATRTHSAIVPDVRPCKFRVWVKYSATNGSSLSWHNAGLFDCHA